MQRVWKNRVFPNPRWVLMKPTDQSHSLRRLRVSSCLSCWMFELWFQTRLRAAGWNIWSLCVSVSVFIDSRASLKVCQSLKLLDCIQTHTHTLFYLKTLLDQCFSSFTTVFGMYSFPVFIVAFQSIDLFSLSHIKEVWFIWMVHVNKQFTDRTYNSMIPLHLV